MTYRELLLGCGFDRTRKIDPYLFVTEQAPPKEQRWLNVLTIDSNPECRPDVIADIGCGLQAQMSGSHPLFERLSDGPWQQLKSNTFHEVHAYEVLEHLGHQGDTGSFFRHFDELWRVLVPNGFLCATVPSRYSEWLWGDPGHRRAILPQTLRFLHRPHYDKWVGAGMSSDYRRQFEGDWDIIASVDDEALHSFILRAIKPARHPVNS